MNKVIFKMVLVLKRCWKAPTLSNPFTTSPLLRYSKQVEQVPVLVRHNMRNSMIILALLIFCSSSAIAQSLAIPPDITDDKLLAEIQEQMSCGKSDDEVIASTSYNLKSCGCKFIYRYRNIWGEHDIVHSAYIDSKGIAFYRRKYGKGKLICEGGCDPNYKRCYRKDKSCQKERYTYPKTTWYGCICKTKKETASGIDTLTIDEASPSQ